MIQYTNLKITISTKVPKLTNKNSYIIAEIGVNHNGSFDRAKKMIYEAKALGANAVKFQYFEIEKLLVKNTKLLNYQKNKNNKIQSQNQLLEKLNLSLSYLKKLRDIAHKVSIDFMCTFFDYSSLNYINDLSIKNIKIPSGEIDNVPYLEKIASFNKPTFLSTGLSNLNDIAESIKILSKNGLDKKKITILHCTTSYPTKDEDVRLSNINEIKKKFKCEVGFSDHSIGYSAALGAITLGCKVIERHFTLSKSLRGPDHLSSSNISEFKNYILQIRKLEKQIGLPRFNLDKILRENKKMISKKIVAAAKIKRVIFFLLKILPLKDPLKVFQLNFGMILLEKFQLKTLI